MKYIEVVEREHKESAGFRAVVERLEKVKGQKVLVFSHDDPDGITCAAIMMRTLKKMGAADVKLLLPPTFELEPEDAEKGLKEYPAQLLIAMDKGTSYKFDLVQEKFPKTDTMVIDHHWAQGEVKKAILYNPTLELKRPYTSCSFLCHLVATYLEVAEPIDLFDALVGLKADWAVDPTSGNMGADDWVKPLAQLGQKKFPNLFELLPGPTLFDFAQREKSSLLSKVAELYFAVSGGGFQYYYPERKELKDVSQPELCLEISLGLAGKEEKIAACEDLKDFLAVCPGKGKVRACREEFIATWDRVVELFKTTGPLVEMNGSTVYFFSADRLALLPMVGSIDVGARVKRDGKESGVLLMLNKEEHGTHFSLRAVGDNIHVGKIAGALAKRLVARYGRPDQITGGGHVRAAECKTRRGGVPHLEAFGVLADLLREMKSLDERRKDWNEEEKKLASEIGLA